MFHPQTIQEQLDSFFFFLAFNLLFTSNMFSWRSWNNNRLLLPDNGIEAKQTFKLFENVINQYFDIQLGWRFNLSKLQPWSCWCTLTNRCCLQLLPGRCGRLVVFMCVCITAGWRCHLRSSQRRILLLMCELSLCVSGRMDEHGCRATC